MHKKVLVVDDSIFIWEEMKRILADTDFEIVGCAKNGKDALALYETLLPDVVTMDFILPGMDGLETTSCLLQKWPDARVVMVSSLAYDESKEEAIEVGACDYVFKPFDKQHIIDVLTKAVTLHV